MRGLSVVLIVALIILATAAIGIIGNIIGANTKLAGTDVYTKADIDLKIKNLSEQIDSCGECAQKNKVILSVRSIPAGAAIYVNNVFRGNTPLEIANLNPNSYYVVKVMKIGYETYMTTKYVRSGNNSVEVSLNKEIV